MAQLMDINISCANIHVAGRVSLSSSRFEITVALTKRCSIMNTYQIKSQTGHAKNDTNLWNVLLNFVIFKLKIKFAPAVLSQWNCLFLSDTRLCKITLFYDLIYLLISFKAENVMLRYWEITRSCFTAKALMFASDLEV